MAQEVERILGKDEVTSSTLVSSSKKNDKHQLVVFFIQADRLGISSRGSVYIINSGCAVVAYHHTAGVYTCRLDDIQLLRS